MNQKMSCCVVNQSKDSEPVSYERTWNEKSEPGERMNESMNEKVHGWVKK
jgi:hypothetical protein